MYAVVRLFLPVLLLITLTGCTRVVPPVLPPVLPPAPPPASQPEPVAGVTANSGGDTRGTISYRPGPAPTNPPDPYAAVSAKITLPQRQKFAWMLAEIDLHAHQQAANADPVPEPGSPRYSSKSAARDAAEQQAAFNAYLLEKYDARFCNQFHLTYDQLALIREEGRDKNWPMPSSPTE